DELLNAFRAHYRRYENAVHEAVVNSTDAVVLWRLGDDLDQYLGLVNEYSTIFSDSEREIILQNVEAMQNDVRLGYQQAVDQSHHGRPTVVEIVHTGGPGRPATVINPDFLRWAYSLRSTASIARFLGLGRAVVRRALLEYGIADGAEYLINPEQEQVPVASFTGPLSEISNDDLDDLLIRLRSHYRRAGLIRWGIVIHGFIDGYSRLITGILASNNNRGQTVLDLFLAA
ncbi:hypothetical protein B0H13DRAFT_2409610, partial [Mycena leptocephala]